MKTIHDDLLGATHGIILHGCNAQGVMGSGVAKLIRAKWPGAYAAYRQAFESSGLKPGQTVWYRASQDPLLMIGNAITQKMVLDVVILTVAIAALAASTASGARWRSPTAR